MERVNAYLKEFFQLNNVRYRTRKRTKVHFNMVTSKLAVDHICAQINQQQAALSITLEKILFIAPCYMIYILTNNDR